MKRVNIFAIALVVFASLPVSATIINIPDDYPTIQQGIDASTVGDIVRVATGTYVENINFNGKNIVVGSWFLDAGDPSYILSTIIDGNAADGVVKFENGETNEARITGFTIQNGSTAWGSGIYCNPSNPTINYNIISGNSADQYGGGIFCYSSNPTISYNTISGNSAGTAAGGIACWDSDPTISNNIISGNSTPGEGGGIWCNLNADPTIDKNTISGNSADLGAGIYCTMTSSPTVSFNTIYGNSAVARGGGIYIWDSSPGIINTIFWANSADTWPEICIVGVSSPVITYCDVEGGWAGETNIDCDPMFCDPENGNFYLDAASCCVGEGEGGANIGAFGVGCGEQEIPTLSEWGMLIMGLLLLAVGTVAVIRNRRAAISKAA